MPKFLSGRKKYTNIGIQSYTESNTVLQTIGKVGIGTTNSQNHSLFVVGSTNITGDISVGGASTFTGVGTFGNDLYVKDTLYVGNLQIPGGSNITEDIVTRNLNVTGVSTFNLISTFNNGIDVSNHTELDNLNVSGIATIANFVVPSGGQFDVYDTQAVFHNNVRIDGNLSIGGTATTLITQDLKVYDKEITLGITTDTFGNDVSTDYTANHGGISIASTEGSPLVDLTLAGFSSIPRTYKQLMWVAANSYGVGTTDAWMFNYAVGIGSTLVPNNVRLAAGNIKLTQNDIYDVRHINASGIITANQFVGSVTGSVAGVAASATRLETPRSFEITGDIIAPPVFFDGTSNVSLAATIQPNSVALGTDTYGNYVATIQDSGLSDIVVNNSGTETAAITLGLTTTGITSGTYGSNTAIPTFTVDSRGRLVSAGTTALATTLNIAGNSGTDSVSLLTDTLTALGGSHIFVGVTDNTFNITVDATSNNVNSTIVSRDGTGGFSAGIITATNGNFSGIVTASGVNVSGITSSSRLILTGDNDPEVNKGQIFLNGSNGNRIDFSQSGVAAPTTSTRSIGTKIVLYSQLASSSVDYAIGIADYAMWHSVPTYEQTYRWYAGISTIAELRGTGELILGGLSSLTGTSNQKLQVTGGAYISGNLGIGTTNPEVKLQVEGDTKISGVLTASQLSTGLSGSAINITSNTISGPSEITIDPAGIGDNTGLVRIKGDLFVDGVQTIINSTTVEIADFIVGIASTATTDLLADGAGILIGPDNTILYNYNSGINSAFRSSENFDLASDKSYYINGSQVLSSTTLGGSVTNSSLTSLGILNQLQVTGVSTLSTTLIGGGATTGTESQTLQVTGGAYVSGNVGIGTTNPQAKLHVIGDTILGEVKITSAGIVTSSGITTVVYYGDGSNLTGVTAFYVSDQEQTSQPVYPTFASSIGVSTVGIATTGLVYIPSTGNLGIGTTNPQAKLDVVGNLNVTGITTLASSGGITTTGGDLYVGGDLYIKDDLFFDEFTARNATITGFSTLGIASATSLYIFGASTFASGATVYGTLDSQQLNITGVSTFDGVSISSGIITSSNPGITTVVYYGDGSKLTGVTAFYVNVQEQTSQPVYPTFASSAGVSTVGIATTGLVFIPSTGNLGVGTTNPVQKLDVNGNIILRDRIYDSNVSAGQTNYILVSNGPSAAWSWKPFSETGAGTLDAIIINKDDSNVGTGTFTTLDFYGNNLSVTEKLAGIAASIRFSDTPTFNSIGIITSGTLSVGGTTGNSGQYLKSTGIGVTWESFPAVRTGFTTIATEGQTLFNFNYNVNYLDVFVNGGKLTSSEYVASNGSTVFLQSPAFANDIVEFVSYGTISTGVGIAASTLGQLSDVSIPSPSVGDVLTFDGTNWIAGPENIVTATTSTTSQTAIHSTLSGATFRSVEYTIQATRGSNYHLTKILVVHDGTTAYKTEYGTIFTGSSLGTFATDLSGGNIRLLVTPSSSSSTTYKIKYETIRV